MAERGHRRSGSEQPSETDVLVKRPDGTLCLGVEEQIAKEREQQRQRQHEESTSDGNVAGGEHQLRAPWRNDGISLELERAVQWRRKRSFYILVALDVGYYSVLLGLLAEESADSEGLSMGKDRPQVVGALAGGAVAELAIILVHLVLDGMAIGATLKDKSSILSLFIACKAVLTGFEALHTIAAFFVFRILLLLLAYQVRISIVNELNRTQPQWQVATVGEDEGRGAEENA